LHPSSLSFAESAALPLTSITAWEAIFDRMKINPKTDAGKNILIIGAAGGVGSIAIQIAKKVANLKVTATASRKESIDWCRKMGADYIINHHEDMPRQFKEMSLNHPDYILVLNNPDQHFATMVELIKPQGMICSILDIKKQHNLIPLKNKSVGLVWEFMFTRSMFSTNDMIKQHQLLNEISQLIDSKVLKSTVSLNLGKMTPENLKEAHKRIETGSTIGKIVLDVGF